MRARRASRRQHRAQVLDGDLHDVGIAALVVRRGRWRLACCFFLKRNLPRCGKCCEQGFQPFARRSWQPTRLCMHVIAGAAPQQLLFDCRYGRVHAPRRAGHQECAVCHLQARPGPRCGRRPRCRARDVNRGDQGHHHLDRRHQPLSPARGGARQERDAAAGSGASVDSHSQMADVRHDGRRADAVHR